jgi:hypothetical protein
MLPGDSHQTDINGDGITDLSLRVYA